MDVNAQTDLTNCDREPIHILGYVQPFACVIALDLDWNVESVSTNIGEFLETNIAFLANDITQFIRPETTHNLKSSLQVSKLTNNTERLVSQPFLITSNQRFDITIHFNGQHVVLEIEKSQSSNEFNAANIARQMISQFGHHKDLTELLNKAVKQIQMLTGYNRVMAYQFLPDDSGEVVAEVTKRNTDSFMGLRYPASDIPKQARALYLKQLIRIIQNVEDERIPLQRLNEDLPPVDLSLAVSRSVSPIHIQYLKNMDVAASMSLSIIVDGKLWGLIACHHSSAKNLSFEIRTILEFLIENLSLKVGSELRRKHIEYDKLARDTYDSVMTQLELKPSSFEGIKKQLTVLSKIIKSDGVGLWLNNHYDYFGQAFDKGTSKLLINKLKTLPYEEFYWSERVSEFLGVKFVDQESVAGFLAISISREPGDYLIYYRKSVSQTVTWAGNPTKPVIPGKEDILHPRHSFEAWQEINHNVCEKWQEPDFNLAKSLRVALLELLIKQLHSKEKLRQQSIEKQDTLISELNHRVHNILSLMRAIVSLSDEAAESKQEFKELLDGRVKAMAFAHDQLTSSNWSSVSLSLLLQNEAEAYLSNTSKITINGPDVDIQAQAVSCLALVMHEMFTNAAKYGALQPNEGKLKLTWHIAPTDSSDAKHEAGLLGDLVIDWEEFDGPSISPPTRKGFGSTIINRSIPYELNGTSDIKFKPSGLTGRFVIPQKYIIATQQASLQPEKKDVVNNHHITKDNVLLVEDNFIIALDAEQLLYKVGFDSVEVCGTLEDAFEYLEEETPQFAVLDYHLGVDNSEAIARELCKRNVPFIFATGYGHKLVLPDDLPKHLPIVVKPYNIESIKAAMDNNNIFEKSTAF